jgi:hypothetical protein
MSRRPWILNGQKAEGQTSSSQANRGAKARFSGMRVQGETEEGSPCAILSPANFEYQSPTL